MLLYCLIFHIQYCSYLKILCHKSLRSLMCAVMLKSGIACRCDFEQLWVRQGEEVQPTCALLFLLWKIKTESDCQWSLVTRLKKESGIGNFFKKCCLFSFIVSKHTQSQFELRSGILLGLIRNKKYHPWGYFGGAWILPFPICCISDELQEVALEIKASMCLICPVWVCESVLR